MLRTGGIGASARLRRVIAAGSISTLLGAALVVAGPGVGTAHAATTETFLKTLAGPSVAEMYPSGLEFDANMNRVVVADTGLNRVDVYSTAGALLFRFGSVGTGPGQFSTPRDAAVDGSSNIYVSDADNDRIEKFDSSGNFQWSAGGLGTCTACLNTPIGVTYDAANNAVLVADTGQSLIKAYNPSTGALLWVSPKAIGIESPRDVTRGPDGRIWIADYHHQEVKAFNVSGNGLTWTTAPAITLGDGKTNGHALGQLNFPYDAAFSPDGHTVYVADTGNERIARWDLTQSPPKPLAPIGSRCAVPCPAPPANGAFFQQLRRVVVDPSGNLWGADFWGSGIHEFSPTGTVLSEIAGAPAPAPGFSEAFGISVGSDGATYVVDRLNQRVQRFDASGTFQNVVGQRGVAPGTYSWPEAVAVAPDGTVWVGDTRNGRLEHYPANLSGTPTTVGSKGTANNQYNYIDGLTVDSNGVVWAADAANNRIHAYNPATSAHTVIGSVGSGNGQFNDPQGVAVSVATSRIYVADTGNNRVQELDLSGNFIASYGTGLSGPEGITLAPDGTVWVADTQHDAIVHLSADLTNLGDGFGSQGDGNMQFFLPHSLAIHNNVLFVADTFNNRVQEFTLSGGSGGTFNPVYSSQISNPGAVASWYPDGGAIDAAGNHYITDSGNSQVVKVAPNGTQTTLFTGSLSHPRGLAMDPDGAHLWIPNSDLNQLVEIDLSGHQVATLGGTATLHSPYGVAFKTGDTTNIYIADTYNFDVVKMNKTTGAVAWRTTTCAGKALTRTRAITIGDDGNVYVTDTDNNRVVVLNPTTGACLRSFGSAGSGNGQFQAPRGIVADGDGGLWVSDNGNYRVEHLQDDGTFIAATTGGYGSGPGQFNAPQEVFMDNGLLDVADTYNYRVDRFTVSASGVPTLFDSIDGTPPANGGFNGAWSVAYAPNGELYATDWFNHRIEAFKPDGSFDFAFGNYGTLPGLMEYPRGVAVSADGSTVAVAQEANDIELFNANGTFKAKVVPSDKSGLHRPRQVTFAPDGSLWVADYGNDRVLHLAANGTVLLTLTAGIQAPQGVALDAAGNVYVADSVHNVVRSFTSTGTPIATLATGGSGPGNVSSPAEMTIIGPAGNQLLLIADSNNNRVVVLKLDGTPVTTFGTSGSGAGQFDTPTAVAYRPSDGTIAVADFLNDRDSLWSTGQTGPAGTSTALVASPPNPGVGASVTLTATVSPKPDGGTMQFTDGGTTISGCAARPVIAATGNATCVTSFSTAATHSIQALYSGDANFAPSNSAPLSLPVGTSPTPTTTTAGAPAKASVGSSVVISATVSPIPDGGPVGWQDGGVAIPGCKAHAVNTTTGKTSCSTTFSTTGTHSITAVYGGDANFASSTSAAVSVTVSPALAHTTTTAGGPATAGAGTSVHLTATVSPVPGGGTVAWKDGGVFIVGCKSHAVNTTTGDAKCTTTFSTTGPHSITAIYSGDATFAGSTSPPISISIS